MVKVKVFLLNIEAERMETVNCDTVATAAIVSEDTDTGKINIKIAERMIIGKIIVKVSKIAPNMTLSGFKIMKDGSIKGNGLISFRGLLKNGTCRAVAVAEAVRTGNSEAVGYVLCDRHGSIGQLTKSKTVEFMMTNGHDSIQNIKLVNPGYGKKAFPAVKDTESVLTYVIGKADSQKNKKASENMLTNKKQNECTKTDDKNAAKKAAVLNKIKDTRLGKCLNDSYSYDAIMYLVYLAKKRRKYDFLLNPAYSDDQMRVIYEGFAEGLDISKYNDPKYSAKDMYDRKMLLEYGFWESADTSKF